MDLTHKSNIQNFRDPDCSSVVTTSLSVSLMNSQLSLNDVLSDSSWFEAPIIVLTNELRYALNVSQVTRFAQRHELPIVRWRRIPRGTFANLSPDQQNRFYELLPNYLYEYFVPGAPALITQNFNPQRGITNGTPCFLHALSFNDPDLQKCYEDALHCAQPGQLISLSTFQRC